MKIANIIYEKDLVNHKKVDYINYYTGSVDEIISQLKNPELPTLYVGWGFMKKFIQLNENLNNVNILKQQIIPNRLYWVFSFEEDKQNHVKGVEDFVYNTPQIYFTSKYEYTNIDPVFHQLSNNQDLFDVLPKKIDRCYYLKERMLYILSDNKIYGLDMEMYRFFKFNIMGIISKLEEMTFNNTLSFDIYHDVDGAMLENYYKLFPNLSLLKRYLVVLVTN